MVHKDLEVTKEIKETRADPVPREILEYRERMVNRLLRNQLFSKEHSSYYTYVHVG